MAPPALLPHARPVIDPRPAGKPWSYREAADALGVCEVTIARAARSGRVKSFKLGRRVLIADVELRRVQVEGF